MAIINNDFIVKNGIQSLAGKIGANSTQQHTIPAVTSDTLTLLAASQALTNKTYNGHTFTPGSSTFTGTAAQTYTFPTTTATLARIDAAQTFTGIQTFSSTIVGTIDAANALKSATTTVSVSAATAPTIGQVLQATSSTTATWQTLAGALSTDDTTTNATYYPGVYTTAGGSTLKTSSTKLTFNPSTGNLTATLINNTNIKYTVTGDNFSIGSLALSALTTGYDNFAFGNSSLQNTTSGFSNIAIGIDSSKLNTSGEKNIAIGASSLSNNLYGGENVAIGFESLFNNYDAWNNVGIGNQALYGARSGGMNVGFGTQALFACYWGEQNSAVGNGASYALTTGTHNCSFGAFTLDSQTTGHNNTAIGDSALTSAKSTSALITSITDYSGTVVGTVLATSTAHGRTTGNSLIISGTISYNGTYTITVVDANTFYFTHAPGIALTKGWWTLASELSSNNTAVGYSSGIGITYGSNNTILGANVTGLAAGLTSNIILANGTGAIKAQHDGVDWTLTGGLKLPSLGTSGLLQIGVDGQITADGAGFSTTDDTTTAATYYPTFVTTAGGSIGKTSSLKLTFNPSTGTLFSTEFLSSSDERLKDNIVTLKNNVETIKALRPVSFNWKDSGKKSYGVIAQELELILPELVEESGDYKRVKYDSLVGFLLGAVQELSDRLDTLEGK